MAKRNRPLPLPSDAELEMLNVIWDQCEASVAEVWRTVSARRPLARNTVLTLIARLEEKGWLQRRNDPAGLRYVATVPRETAMQQLVRKLIDTAFRGSAEGLAMTLLEAGDLSDDELERVRTMLDSARQDSERSKE